MNILDQADRIISDALSKQLSDNGVPLPDFTKSMYIHLLHEKDSITFDLTNNNLKEFIETPIGRLWTLIVTEPTKDNRAYYVESIKLLRKLLSTIKTLSDASVLRPIPPDPKDGHIT